MANVITRSLTQKNLDDPLDPAHRLFSPALAGGALLEPGCLPSIALVTGHWLAHPRSRRGAIHFHRGRRSGVRDFAERSWSVVNPLHDPERTNANGCFHCRHEGTLALDSPF